MASIAARVQRGPWRMKTYTGPLRLRISLEILVRESGIMRKICSKHLLFSKESREAAYDTELLVVTGQRTGMSYRQGTVAEGRQGTVKSGLPGNVSWPLSAMQAETSPSQAQGPLLGYS